ncbi:MAG TPA: hypothetical protein VN634_04700 [Candidatus Limnocylindrales bacterium]|nr:hypothetical protein [Candidatus Limnocylindrales bacterium]
MFRVTRLRPVISAISIAAFLLAASPARAVYDPADSDVTLDQEASEGPAIILDVVIVRPLGLVATVVGTALFVVALPFAAATRDYATPAHFLVVQPARFTFERPLGDWSEQY